MDVKAVLFDLDGTLLDTAPDLAWALNQLRGQYQLEALTLEAVRPHVSHGVSRLVQAGFGIGKEAPNFGELRQQLIALYSQAIALHTKLFPGIEAVLSTLVTKQIPWGIVTNKTTQLTTQLLEALALPYKAGCVICGDTLERAKPHPEPVLHACQLLGVEPPETIFVGDARQDIQAGQAAGTKTLLALYGYLHSDDTPHDWSADGTIRHPLEILDWI